MVFNLDFSFSCDVGTVTVVFCCVARVDLLQLLFPESIWHNMHSVCLPLRQGTLNILLCSSWLQLIYSFPLCASAGPWRNIVALLLPKRENSQGPEHRATGAIWISQCWFVDSPQP